MPSPHRASGPTAVCTTRPFSPISILPLHFPVSSPPPPPFCRFILLAFLHLSFRFLFFCRSSPLPLPSPARVLPVPVVVRSCLRYLPVGSSPENLDQDATKSISCRQSNIFQPITRSTAVSSVVSAPFSRAFIPTDPTTVSDVASNWQQPRSEIEYRTQRKVFPTAQ